MGYRIDGLSLCGACITALLIVSAMTAAGQLSTEQILNTSGPDRANCVSMGFDYTTISGVNGGKPICRFPDGSWCDAHAFFNGTCATNLTSVSNPYYFANPQGALDLASATRSCQRGGGVVNRVHTAYGDVDLCTFPDGRTVDLRALANGAYIPAYGGIFSSVYGQVYGGDDWFYYAYSWLNAP